MLLSFRDNVYINSDRSDIPNYFLNHIELNILKMSAEKRETIDFRSQKAQRRDLLCLHPAWRAPEADLSPAQIQTICRTRLNIKPLPSSPFRSTKDLTCLKRARLRTRFQGSGGYEQHIKCYVAPLQLLKPPPPAPALCHANFMCPPN